MVATLKVERRAMSCWVFYIFKWSTCKYTSIVWIAIQSWPSVTSTRSQNFDSWIIPAVFVRMQWVKLRQMSFRTALWTEAKGSLCIVSLGETLAFLFPGCVSSLHCSAQMQCTPGSIVFHVARYTKASFRSVTTSKGKKSKTWQCWK